jgi:hypothetical protein
MGARLLTHDIDIESFANWPKLQELRLLANTVKHAEGKSSSELMKIRPDLFIFPKSFFAIEPKYPRPVYSPMSGDDIYVQLKDFNEYADALKGFWKEFTEILEIQGNSSGLY